MRARTSNCSALKFFIFDESQWFYFVTSIRVIDQKRLFSACSAWCRPAFSRPLGKQCSKACICDNKPKQRKNMRSYFSLFVLIAWFRPAFSRPLDKRCSQHCFYWIKPKNGKIWEAIFTFLFLILEAEHAVHNLLITFCREMFSSIRLIVVLLLNHGI